MPTNRLTKLFNDRITVEEHGDFQIINGVYVHKSHKMRVRLDPPEHGFDCEPTAVLTRPEPRCGDCPEPVGRERERWERRGGNLTVALVVLSFVFVSGFAAGGILGLIARAGR